jgi:hypothetical protein
LKLGGAEHSTAFLKRQRLRDIPRGTNRIFLCDLLRRAETFVRCDRLLNFLRWFKKFYAIFLFLIVRIVRVI